MSKVTPHRDHSQTSPIPAVPGGPLSVEGGVNGPRSGSRSDAVGAVEAGLSGYDDRGQAGWDCANRYATRSGELSWAVGALLSVIDRSGIELGCHGSIVDQARRLLAEATPTNSL